MRNITCNPDSQIWLGLSVFLVGLVFLLQRFEVIPTDTWSYLWPLLLIILGIKWMGSTCSGSCELPAAKPVAKKAPSKKRSTKKKSSK